MDKKKKNTGFLYLGNDGNIARRESLPEIRNASEGSGIDWNVFAENYKGMERHGDGKGRRVDAGNMEFIYDELVKRGYSGNQLYSVLANIVEESGGDPFAKSSDGEFYGLFQESKDRYPESLRKKDEKLSAKDAIVSILDRVDAGIKDGTSFTHGGKGSGYRSWRDASGAFWNTDSDLPDVNKAFVYGFERPSDKEGTYINRTNAALIIRSMDMMNRKQEGGDVRNTYPKESLWSYPQMMYSVRASGANYVKRLAQPDRSSIPDWEFPDKIATHKLAAEIGEDGEWYVFPVVQEVDGALYDFSDPKNSHGDRYVWDAMDRAIETGDCVRFPDKESAIWFTENYKDTGEFPAFEDGGGIDPSYYASRDATSVGSVGTNANFRVQGAVVEPMDISSMIAGAIPLIGDVMDVRDFYRSARERDGFGMALAAVGFIPFIGMYANGINKMRKSRKMFSGRDKELLNSFPEYATANSPYRDAWMNHQKRLMSGALERLGYSGRIDGLPDNPHVPVYASDSEEFVDHIYDLYNGKYSKKEIRSAFDDLPAFSAIGDAFVINPRKTKEYTDRFIEDHPGMSARDFFNFVMSHETDHIIHTPSEAPPKDAFDFSRAGEDANEYFSRNYGTEASARGTQIKNYFGLTDDSQEITPEMLEYAKRNYIADYGDDNNMREFFNSIVDLKKAARWLSTHSSVGLGAGTLGSRYMGEPDEKRDGGPTLYQLGFRMFDHRPEYGNVKDIKYAYPVPPRYSMKSYLGEKDLDEYMSRAYMKIGERM